VLSAIFASRVTLAKKTEDEAVVEAREDWRKTQKWILSASMKERLVSVVLRRVRLGCRRGAPGDCKRVK